MDQDTAFGWPSGTVRALIAFVIIGVALIAHLVLIIWLVRNGEWQIAAGLAGTLWTSAGMIASFYFGRGSGAAAPPPSR